MPIFRHRHDEEHGDQRRRLIRDDDEYTDEELQRGEVELEQVARRPEPDVGVQGEPMGWTKPGPRPKGWREDGRYDGDARGRGDPGPYDGAWEPPEERHERPEEEGQQ